MRFQYHLHYRDEIDAAAARFPGDPVSPAGSVPGAPPRGLGWVILGLVATLVCLLWFTPARLSPQLVKLLVQADRNDHPVFVAGIVVSAVGAATFFFPLTYLLGKRRSDLPLNEYPVTARLDDIGITLEGPSKRLDVSWSGVVAVAETRGLFVLKTLGDLRLALPKRALDRPERIDALRRLLRDRVPPLAAPAADLVAALPPRAAA